MLKLKYVAAAIIKEPGCPSCAIGFLSQEQYTRDCVLRGACILGIPGKGERRAEVVYHEYFGLEKAIGMDELVIFAAENGVDMPRAQR